VGGHALTFGLRPRITGSSNGFGMIARRWFLELISAASLATASSQGLPPIIQNPDTLIAGGAGTIDMAALEAAADEVLDLTGARFGIAVRDFSTGEGFTRGTGTFEIGTPELILSACAIDLDARGLFPLDTLSSRNETLADQIIMAREGDIEATMRIGDLLKDLVPGWLREKGFTGTTYSGTQLLWPGAPEVAPNMSSPSDCMGMLAIIEARLSEPEIRRITRNPFTRMGLEDIQTGDMPLYGFCSRGAGGQTRAAVAFMPNGKEVGIVILADSLCCTEKADLAFRMMWAALQ
jgi:hypothetical protein